MTIEQEILINKFGQHLIDRSPIIDFFAKSSLLGKRQFLNEFVFLLMQTKTNDDDINSAIEKSGLKKTLTPCIMIKKGVGSNNLIKLTALPEGELHKVLKLFLSLFELAYSRRYAIEKGDPNKWWYWDLSDERLVQLVKDKYDY